MPVGLYAGANVSLGNGVTVAFPYNFKILDQTHIEVKVDGVLQVLGADYSVSGVGNSNGGNVTFGVAPAAAAVVQRARKVPYKRDQDYQYNGDLREEVVDPDLDTIEMQVQQIAADAARAFKAPLSVTTDQVLSDANWAARAGKYLGFDGAGVLGALSGTMTGVAIEAVHQVVGTIALLKARAVPTVAEVVFVLGYYAALDIGGGSYYWDAASVLADNGGTVIQPNAAPAAGRWRLKVGDNGVSGGQFGAKGDGVTDDVSKLQACSDWCITNGVKMTLPAKDFSIGSPWLLAKWSGAAFSYFGLTLEGERYPWDSNVAGSLISTRILPTFRNTFAIGIQNARGVRIKDIVCYGINNMVFTAGYPEMMVNGTFVTGGSRDSRYSPYAGIVIDPFGNGVPADGGYPGMGAYYVASAAGSSGVTLERVITRYFVVGAIVTPNGVTQNAEDIHFKDCDIAYNKAGVAVCQSQSRDVTWHGGECAFNLFCFDGLTYGAQTGQAPRIFGANCAGKYLFNVNNMQGTPLEVNGLHAEAFGSIGFIGAGASSSGAPAKFSGCLFSPSDFNGKYADHFLATWSPVLFETCDIVTSNMATPGPLRMYHQPGRPIVFDSCWLGPAVQKEMFLAPTMGSGSLEMDEVYFRNCMWGDNDTRGPAAGSGELSNHIIKNDHSDLDRWYTPEGSWIFLHNAGGGAQDLRFVQGARNTVNLGAGVAVVFAADGTATFTVADGTIVRVGDLIYTTTNKNYESSSLGALASSSNCIGIVSSVVGNNITTKGAPQSLANGNYDINKIWWSRFHRASVGDITNTNANILNVTNVATWAIGNAIKGAGIPAGAYITNIVGTTVTISKPATATTVGIRLFDADVFQLAGVAI